MEKLRVGVIGCGRISVRHLLSLKAIEDVELVACCDNKPERADEAAKEYGIKAYYSYDGRCRRNCVSLAGFKPSTASRIGYSTGWGFVSD